MSTHYVTAHIECAGIEIELDVECDVTSLGEPAGFDDPGCGPEYDMTIRTKHAGIALDYDRDLTDEQRGIVDDAVSDASASWAEDEEHDMAAYWADQARDY